MTRALPGSFPQPEKKKVRIRSMKHRNLSDLGNNISGGLWCVLPFTFSFKIVGNRVVLLLISFIITGNRVVLLLV